MPKAKGQKRQGGASSSPYERPSKAAPKAGNSVFKFNVRRCPIPFSIQSIHVTLGLPIECFHRDCLEGLEGLPRLPGPTASSERMKTKYNKC